MGVSASKSGKEGSGFIREVVRLSQTGEANTPFTLSTPTGDLTELLAVTMKVSAGSPDGNVSIILNSGAGSAFDLIIDSHNTTSSNRHIYQPVFPVPLLTDDVIDVVIPAVGAGLTVSVVIYTRKV